MHGPGDRRSACRLKVSDASRHQRQSFQGVVHQGARAGAADVATTPLTGGAVDTGLRLRRGAGISSCGLLGPESPSLARPDAGQHEGGATQDAVRSPANAAVRLRLRRHRCGRHAPSGQPIQPCDVPPPPTSRQPGDAHPYCARRSMAGPDRLPVRVCCTLCGCPPDAAALALWRCLAAVTQRHVLSYWRAR